MSLREELQTIDSDKLLRTADAVHDKFGHLNKDLISMVGITFDEYPSFNDLTLKLIEKYFADESLSIEQKKAAVIGAVTVMSILREHVKVQEMEAEFPDVPR